MVDVDVVVVRFFLAGSKPVVRLEDAFRVVVLRCSFDIAVVVVVVVLVPMVDRRQYLIHGKSVQCGLAATAPSNRLLRL